MQVSYPELLREQQSRRITQSRLVGHLLSVTKAPTPLRLRVCRLPDSRCRQPVKSLSAALCLVPEGAFASS